MGGRRMARKSWVSRLTLLLRLSVGTTAGELGLKFLHAAGGIHEALFAREGRVRIHGHVTHHDVMVHALVILGLA